MTAMAELKAQDAAEKAPADAAANHAVNGTLAQILYSALTTGTRTTTTRRQYISSFESFILNHIPYAQVELKHLQTGLIDWDGPGAPGGDSQKPLLVWYFAGQPYPIVNAARIGYTYQLTWDGSNAPAWGTILLGFQSDKNEHKSSHALAISPRASVRIDSHVFVDQLTQTIRGLTNALPSSVVTGVQSYTNLDDLVFGQIQSAVSGVQARTPAGPTSGYALSDGSPFTIEFDGPARDNDGVNIFAYTIQTLFNDVEKFNQILWWYFGGQPQRITKAMRIPLTNSDGGPSLFVGFTGPGPYP
jgi:hypothetical protein